jgi:hypothetical protein
MILSREIEIKITEANYYYYEFLGYELLERIYINTSRVTTEGFIIRYYVNVMVLIV